jgi:hypothetical protein
MKVTKTIVLVGVSVLLSRCLPDPLPVNSLPPLRPTIVVSSELLPDSSVVVLVTNSFGALEADDDSDPVALLNQIAINDATVVIEGGGVVDTLTLFGPGLYRTESLPMDVTFEYELRVFSDDLGKVNATTQVRPPVTFSELSARINDTGFDTLATINYSFKDGPGTSYYMVNVEKISTDDLPAVGEFLNPSVFTNLLTDRAKTDGTFLTDSFNVLFQDDFTPGDTLLVQLGNISPGYYDFLELRRETRFNFSDFLGEPVNYPTNVNGGLGWFSLHFKDIRIITISE